MTGNGEPLPKIYLKPGELLVAEDPVKVLTVLGSCISVTMYAARTGVSAICHAMLPTDSGSDNFKFVDSSLQHMLEYFKQHRITRGEIQVKLFGGADMFCLTDPGSKERSVGAQNINMAQKCLRAAGFNPTVSDVGGDQGRKLIFHSDTGVVLLKRLPRQDMKHWL